MAAHLAHSNGSLRTSLSGHSQKTCFKGAFYNSLPVSFGVPQDSILGPLFFILFINDLPFFLSFLPSSGITMFADDTTLLSTGKNVPESAVNLNILASSDDLPWARQNRMALNATKSKCMLFTSQQKRRLLSSKNLDVSINDSPIQQVRCAKVLGEKFDESASWEPHVESLCKLLNSRLCLVRRISHYLNKSGTLRFYNACLHSKLLYYSSVWGSCLHNFLLQNQRLQKHAARIILSADYTKPSVDLFSELNWIPIADLVKCKKLQLLFSIVVNPDAPVFLRQKLDFLTSSRYATRGSTANNLKLKQPRTNFGKSCFSFSAPLLLCSSIR